MADSVRKVNPVAKALRTLRQKVLRNKKAYTRKVKHKKKELEEYDI